MHIKVYHFFKFSAISILKIEVSEAITQIGELAKTSLSDVAKDEATSIPWKQILWYAQQNSSWMNIPAPQ